MNMAQIDQIEQNKGDRRSYVAMETWILLTMPTSEIAVLTQILSKARGSL